jgi:hypothetical protein
LAQLGCARKIGSEVGPHPARLDLTGKRLFIFDINWKSFSSAGFSGFYWHEETADL